MDIPRKRYHQNGDEKWRGTGPVPHRTGKRLVKREALDAGSGNNFGTEGGGGTTAAPTCRIGVNLRKEKIQF